MNTQATAIAPEAETATETTGKNATAGEKALSVSATSDDQQLQLVTFEVGHEEFAVDILVVQEINRMMTITSVPQSPQDVVGVINLRGRIIPVIELRTRFGLEAVERGNDSRIIVVDVSGRTIGFIVDKVNEVLRISGNIVDPAPSMVAGVDSDYIQGVGKLEDRLLILLDLERLFSAQDLKTMDAVLDQAGA